MSELPKYVVYLLHSEAADGPALHYVGITTPRSYLRRMQDHKSGNAAVRTRLWYDLGRTCEIAGILATDDAYDERRIEKFSDLSVFCWLCNNPQKNNRPQPYRSYQQPRIKYGHIPKLFAFPQKKSHRLS